MGKHKLKDQDLLDDVDDALNDFLAVLRRIRKTGSVPRKIKATAKKAVDAVDEALDEIVFKAKSAAQDITNLAKDLISDPSVQEETLRELKKKGERLEHKIHHIIKYSTRLANNVKTALTHLKDAIVDAFKALGNVFKSIFTPPVPHGGPTFTHNAHLRNEQAFKAKSVKVPPTGLHRKILTKP